MAKGYYLFFIVQYFHSFSLSTCSFMFNSEYLTDLNKCQTLTNQHKTF